jgi:hypothetical protein
MGDKIKMDLQEVEWEDMDLIYLTQDRNRWIGTCEWGNEYLATVK